MATSAMLWYTVPSLSRSRRSSTVNSSEADNGAAAEDDDDAGCMIRVCKLDPNEWLRESLLHCLHDCAKAS